MHSVSVRAAAETEQVDAVGDVRPLNPVEQALRAALTDEFMSTSVVRERARLRVAKTSPDLAKAMLSRGLPVATTLSAFYELERRGLAEQSFVTGCVRWRRAREAGGSTGPRPTSEHAASA
jgi:hypothetical protein